MFMTSELTNSNSQTGHGNHGAHEHGAHTHADSVVEEIREQEVQGSEVFTHLIGELGDHHEVNMFFGHAPVLPVILWDDGLHAYANPSAMTAAGMYSMHEGHPVRKSDGGHPALDLSITNFVVYEWLAIAILSIAFIVGTRRYKTKPLAAPSGLQNLLESFVVYIRDEMVVPNVGTVSRAMRLMPYIMGLFFFILALNLFGLLPGNHSATGALGLTCALALTSYIVVNFIAIKDAGIGTWLHHLLGGAPVFLAPIMVPIEIISIFTKPFALMIRLFANMTAGHIVLLSLVGLIFFFESWLVTPVSVGFSVFIYMLELLVAFLQAYIFAMLTAVFIGLALGDHATHEHSHTTNTH